MDGVPHTTYHRWEEAFASSVVDIRQRRGQAIHYRQSGSTAWASGAGRIDESYEGGLRSAARAGIRLIDTTAGR